MNFDVFNGDADGIISLLQLRFAYPKDSVLISGVKRDVSLVKHIPLNDLNNASEVTVLDLSFQKNRAAIDSVLKSGASVLYIDHHQPGTLLSAPKLTAHINQSANYCTALIVDELLEHKYHFWAITAAYGDNLIEVATKLALKAGLTEPKQSLLKELGSLINYNGYGSCLDELAYHPAELYKQLLQYSCPFECIADKTSPFHVLKRRYAMDLEKVSEAEVIYDSAYCFCVLLKNDAASRRMSGTFGNELANQNPARSHIILSQADEHNYQVSLRAPLSDKQGAGELCSQFETGGGRAAAGGINKLPKHSVKQLISAVEDYYQQGKPAR